MYGTICDILQTIIILCENAATRMVSTTTHCEGANTAINSHTLSFSHTLPATLRLHGDGCRGARMWRCEESAPLVVRTLELPPRPLATPISVLAILPDSIRIGWSLDTMATGDYGPPTSYKVKMKVFVWGRAGGVRSICVWRGRVSWGV